MFSKVFSGKIYPQPKKAKRKHSRAYWIIGAVTLSIESMLGLNAAFLIDQSVSIVARTMLDGTVLEVLASLIALIISLLFGACLVAGGLWVFGGFMDSLEDARAFQKAYGYKGWPETLVWILMIAIILIDLTTLCFRATYFAERGWLALFAFFVILVFLPPVLGPLIYVLENTPRDRRLAKVRVYGEALETDDAEEAMRYMDPDLRSRWISGDSTALQEHYRRVEERQAEIAAYEQQQIEDQQRKQGERQRPLV